ncbi:Ger(x)C family spore germination protein [Paenibacillus macquariensis]|uniref:Germination protein, Ger(X)C family n=1 Tax=Paenibacillus macquariensis TaxID=948756 RepID=A0ABY1JN96_9BACL|nr:Ger(x)C family spore germination protein [Paenibacillus macquariensis]MEC0092205.1 Ger(x)C family spore germination protein [Paenibacillus macquariensis]OAB37247.1 hypothetical protein PMSM_03995 [Paenibacillus macquariensis subsp. macquariensis]SIQ48982.1 germination protein, Ger(x)C family [Paenibacillus macquariensis]
MKLWKRLTGIVVSLALLSGCWDSKEIENMAYVTALGFDYVDGKYKAYAQILNFSNIAKNEGAEIGKVVPAWIGQGEGTTVSDAVNSLYATSQNRIFWGHVRTIVCSENLLKQGTKIQDVYSAVNRYREIRYNILIYGTKEPIAKIFALKSILNFSPIESILSTPDQVYKQFSIIKPIFSYKAIADSSEGTGSCILPSLSIDTGTWLEDEKEKSLLKMNGAYLLKYRKYLGWLTDEDLKGARWLQKGIDRVPINVPTDEPKANMVILNPRNDVSPIIVNGKVQYNIKVSVEAFLNELLEPLSDHNLKKETSEAIVAEIQHTFEKGLRIKSDVLNLEDSLFRSNPRKWNEIHQGKEDIFVLTKDSLHKIEVYVHIIHGGKYKAKV